MFKLHGIGRFSSQNKICYYTEVTSFYLDASSCEDLCLTPSTPSNYSALVLLYESQCVFVTVCICASVHKLAFVRQTEHICFVNIMCHAAAHRPRHYGMEKKNKEERS